MRVDRFDYDLPEELIAQKPVRPRDSSRLLLLDRRSKTWEETVFRRIVDHFHPGDCLVLNDTRVIPARLVGRKKESGGKVELLLLNQRDGDGWEALVKPGRRIREGMRLVFEEGRTRLEGEVGERTDYGGRVVRFFWDGDFDEILDLIGMMPVPPYIEREIEKPEEYQTIYAEKRGSAAAPTAGFHFTERVFSDLEKKGVEIARITLHVGLGTFRPVRAERVEEHEMHSEFYEVRPEAADTINTARERGKRIIAVGTTVTRTLESAALEEGYIEPGRGWTDLFIVPGYDFQVIDGLITNFHLPRSTLLMLVSAFAGYDLIRRAYEYAVENRFRFYSFGDAMFIR